MTRQTFDRRRNVWFMLTIAAFLSPAYWIYAGFAVLVLSWAVRLDKNPLGLFCLVVFAVPNAKFNLPGIVFNQLFDLTQYRLLTFVVLVPWIIRWAREEKPVDQRWLHFYDLALWAFIALQVALLLPYQSPTESLRQLFLLTIDCFAIFFAFSRLSDRARLVDVMMCFCISALLMAAVAVIEWLKGWLLYTGLSDVWGDPNIFAYTLRGDRLRVQASSGNTLNLGYHLAIALTFLAYLRTLTIQWARVWVVLAVTLVALYGTSSRGPWLTALLAIVTYFALRPDAVKKLSSVLVSGTLIIAFLYLTPLKESIIDRLPIIGNSDQETIEYRQQLADLSFELIGQNPLFGDPFAASHMESLRQGQGIIDIVNGYLFTLLFTGWVGLSLQLICWLGSFVIAINAWRKVRVVSPDLGAIGAVLLASFVATLFFHATSGTGPTTYVLAALLVSFASVCRQLGPAIGNGTRYDHRAAWASSAAAQ